jgi:hypothetical protein
MTCDIVPAVTCAKCGGDDLDAVDFVLACRDCGFQADEAELGHIPEKSCSVVELTRALKVSTQHDRPHMDSVSAPVARQTSACSSAAKALATQAAACAQEMHLPQSVASATSVVLQSSVVSCTAALGRAPQAVAVAVLVCVAARLAQYPLSLRSACAHVHAAVQPALRLFVLVLRRMPSRLPAVSVRSVLVTCAAASFSQACTPKTGLSACSDEQFGGCTGGTSSFAHVRMPLCAREASQCMASACDSANVTNLHGACAV